MQSSLGTLVKMLDYIITFCNIYEFLGLRLDRECLKTNVQMIMWFTIYRDRDFRSQLNLGY